MSGGESTSGAESIGPPDEDSRARAGSDALLVGLGYLASFAYPLVSLPFLARAVGVDALGLLIFALATLQVVISITDFGFGMGALRRIATAGTRTERSRIVAATIAAKLLLWAVCSAILLVIVAAVPALREQWTLFAVGLAFIGAGTLYPAWLLQGTGRVRAFALITASTRLIALGFLLLTVRGPQDLVLAMLWQQLPLALSAAAAWIMILGLWRSVDLVRTTPVEVAAALRDAWPLFLSSIAALVMGSANSVVLGIVSAPAQVAYFGAGERFSNAGRGVMRGVVDVMLPRMTRSGEDARRIQRTIQTGIIGAYVLAGLALILSAPWFIPWYLGEAMAPAALIMQLMGIALALAGVSAALQLRATAAHRFTAIARIALTGAGVHLLLLIPASIQWGAVGAGCALIVSETVLAVLYLRDAITSRRPPVPALPTVPVAERSPTHEESSP